MKVVDAFIGALNWLKSNPEVLIISGIMLADIGKILYKEKVSGTQQPQSLPS